MCVVAMLRKLTEEQVRDWFTIGKTVTGVELLGGTLPSHSRARLAMQEPLAAVG